MKQAGADKPPPKLDHRVQVAANKRAAMRARLLKATMEVFAKCGDHVPAIEDVVRVAGVSRGTFYLHFLSLDEALHALSLAQSDQLTRDALHIYDVLKEPWQRFSVGMRLFLERARVDPTWASFVTRSITVSSKLLATSYMKKDLHAGQKSGQFSFTDLDVAVEFMQGACTACICALGLGVLDPEAYVDAGVRMALIGLGCTSRQAERGVAFSREYLAGWTMNHLAEAHL